MGAAYGRLSKKAPDVTDMTPGASSQWRTSRLTGGRDRPGLGVVMCDAGAAGNKGLVSDRRFDMNFHVYRDTRLEWRWRLRAANNRIIADSAEGYARKGDCLAAIRLVKGSGNAPIFE